MKHKITVLPEEKIIEVENRANLRSSLIDNGFEIKSVCGGCASCSSCIVVIKDGLENLSEILFEEKQLIGNVIHLTGERLSCQAEVLGDITVDISMHLGAPKPPKGSIKRRSREEYEKVIEERRENSKNKPQKQGGFKRPKPFKDPAPEADEES